MAFGGQTPGATALKPTQAQNLVGSIASSQAFPENPKTANERKDPREESILNLQRVRKALEILTESLDESPTKEFLGLFHSAITRLRDGVQVETVQAQLLKDLSPPPMMAGGMGMPSGLAPSAQMPSTAGAPPMAGPPVSPGPPGQ